MFIVRYKLTAEEKAKPYAKYFYREVTPPDPEKLAKMDQPIDPGKALPIERINDLLKPGYLDVEIGWCIMPDGSGFIANHNIMPGVTVEMLKWWFAWHSLEDLRYKIWYKPGHFAISVSEEARERILDPKTSIDEKLWGITHHVVEACDGPTENIYISFLSPEDLGFDMNLFKPPYAAAVFGGNGVSQMVSPPPGAPNRKSPAVMVHLIREIEGGVEMRTRFWMGKKMIDKKPVHCLPRGAKIPPFVPQNLARHNVKEFANLASFLPQIYEEQKDKPMGE